VIRRGDMCEVCSMQTRGVGVRDVAWNSVCIGMCVCV